MAILLLAISLIVLLVLSWSDLRRRHLSNRYVGAYALLFLPYAWLTGVGLGQLGGHALVAVVAFLCLFILYMVGAMGGGDVKLGTAVLLWAGPALSLPVVAIIAWTGGGVAVLGWLTDRRLGRRWMYGCRPVHRIWYAWSARRGVPYGVALAAGGFYIIWRHFVGTH